VTIEAKVILDGINEQGNRITTFQCRYPKFIHGEAKTHRIQNLNSVLYEETLDYGFMDDNNLSRNASSSRAIPVERIIADIRRDPAMPVFWGSNKPGMQAGDELNEVDKEMCKTLWLAARDECIFRAEFMIKNGLHKQIANRILEPWCHINVVVTATEYQNFFTLRRHKDAQPEAKALADAMWEAREASSPRLYLPGDWYLPYITEEDHTVAYKRATENLTISGDNVVDLLRKVSVARCARVSYLTHDGRQTSVEEDLELFERLVGAQPLHASPAEHQATPDHWNLGMFNSPELHGNFTGWIQYRKTLPGEFVEG